MTEGPFRKILIPLDGSSLAERVLPTVERLAHAHQCEVLLVRVVVPVEVVLSGSGYMDVTITAELRTAGLHEAQVYLDAKCGELRGVGLQMRAMVVEGMPGASILAMAENESVDLIAMTTHGRSGLSRLLQGSVAEQVMHTAPCPVLLISARSLRAPDAAVI
jgi:nucleotide-binding universal stress UspA family protein